MEGRELWPRGMLICGVLAAGHACPYQTSLSRGRGWWSEGIKVFWERLSTRQAPSQESSAALGALGSAHPEPRTTGLPISSITEEDKEQSCIGKGRKEEYLFCDGDNVGRAGQAAALARSIGAAGRRVEKRDDDQGRSGWASPDVWPKTATGMATPHSLRFLM